MDRFWDWTHPRTAAEGLPNVLRPQLLQMRPPNLALDAPAIEVENPLAFHLLENGPPSGSSDVIHSARPGAGISYFSVWTRTYRRPSSSQNPFEDYVNLDAMFRERLESLRNLVGRLFSYPVPGAVVERRRPTVWNEFSNTRRQRTDNDSSGWPPVGSGTIEESHNLVHVFLGGRGAMGSVDHAAFDPIFYLHHCNVDRILAFWEHTYDKFWLGDGYYEKAGDGTVIPWRQPRGSWGEEDNAEITQKSPLRPYRNGKGEYWTSLQARFVKDENKYKHGYTYPEIVAVVDGETRKVDLDDPRPADDDQVRLCKAVLQAHFGLTKPGAGKVDLGDQANDPFPNYRRFFLSIKLVEYAFNGSYLLELVYGGRVVATFAVFARSDSTQCAACQGRMEDGGFVGSSLDIPDDVVEAVVDAHMDELLGLQPSQRLGRIAGAVKKDIRVQLVDAGGQLLADTVGTSARASVDQGDKPLEESITPEIKLMASRAFVGMGSNRSATGEIEFGEPDEFGDYVEDKWRKVEMPAAEGEILVGDFE